MSSGRESNSSGVIERPDERRPSRVVNRVRDFGAMAIGPSSVEEDALEVEHEAGQDVLAGEGGGAVEGFDGPTGPVNLDEGGGGVEQPSEPDALFEIFPHLFA